MKKFCVIMVLTLLLGGCNARETFETVDDGLDVPAVAQAGKIMVNLPENALEEVMEGEDEALYLCEGYHVVLQTLPGGDLSSTLRNITGYGKEEVCVMETKRYGMDRYDFVWTSASEQGDQIGRGSILSDGTYHYCVSVMGSAEDYLQYEDAFHTLLSSFYVN